MYPILTLASYLQDLLPKSANQYQDEHLLRVLESMIATLKISGLVKPEEESTPLPSVIFNVETMEEELAKSIAVDAVERIREWIKRPASPSPAAAGPSKKVKT